MEPAGESDDRAPSNILKVSSNSFFDASRSFPFPHSTSLGATIELNGVDDEFYARSSAPTVLSVPPWLTVEPLPCPAMLIILLGISWQFLEKIIVKSLGSKKSWAVHAIPLVLVIILALVIVI